MKHKDNSIGIRLDDELMNYLVAVSNKYGISVSRFLRFLIRDANEWGVNDAEDDAWLRPALRSRLERFLSQPVF